MTSREMHDGLWPAVMEFLNQNDLLILAQTSKKLSKVSLQNLYGRIVISKEPVMRSDEWFLDCSANYVSGYRSTKKTPDQNDIFLYDRIKRLTESSHLALVKELVIQEDVFYDRESGLPVLQALIDRLLELDQVEVLDIRDSALFEHNYSKILELTHLRKCRVVNIGDLGKLRSLPRIKSLEISLTHPDFKPRCLSDDVKKSLSDTVVELTVDDLEHSSLRLFQYFHKEGMRLGHVTSLKFNHVHGIHDYNKTMRELTTIFLKDVFDLKKIESLELEGSCEASDCTCFNDFLMDMAPELVSVRSLGLIEKNFVTQGDHNTEEEWDLTINRFILHIPKVSERLKNLTVRHNPPLNGITVDSVEGNYIRRRTLYDNVLPKLTNLQTLVGPTFLKSLSAYEILVCDLLWNGCECSFCAKVLPVIDQYIMNHQYYSFPDGSFKDVIPTVFFAYTGDALSRRFITETDWDLKTLATCPVSHVWDLHGYESLQHFKDFDCFFDESVFMALTKCVSHFFNTYMDHLVKFMPNMRTCVLSGVYYSVDEQGKYKSIYD
ncbi:hypothetical protein ACU8KH_01227 [Lachancea thermotolerans]